MTKSRGSWKKDDGAWEVDNIVEDLVDASGNKGGLEELAEVFGFLGALESADNTCGTSQHSGMSDSPSLQ